MKKPVTLALAAICTVCFSFSAMAQDASTAPIDPGHPRVNEVEQRIDNQQNRVDQGVSDGQINTNQAARDDAKLGREQNSLNQDMTKDNGHITKGDQKNLNQRLNKGSKRIHHQRKNGQKAPSSTPVN